MADVEEKESLKVLILGMGTGTFATQCSYYFDNMEVEGVEIDDKITDLARTYFELPKETKVTTYDGRAYLNAVDTKYDVIMVDAYQDITIPFQMSSVEFFALVREHLTEDGVMVVNMNMRGSNEGSINDYLADTIASVFGTVYTADVAGSTNRELFASENSNILDTFQENSLKIENQNLFQMMKSVASGFTEYKAGNYVMTDDKAPVELLGMQVIDELIQDEVAYYKEIYDENGISGVLDMLE
jgi:spermidine synthase